MRGAVRAAVPADLDWIIASLRDLDGHFAVRKLFMPQDNEEYARGALTDLIERHFFRILERAGVPIGLIAGLTIQHIFNPSLLSLVEVFWWVDPAIQGRDRARIGLQLMDEFTAWGKENADLVIFSLMAGSTGRHALEKRGYEEKQIDYYLGTGGPVRG